LPPGAEQAPIVSPHGHTDPAWFAQTPFGNATELLLRPDHYLFRMLYSQGVALEDLGIGPAKATYDPRKAWRILAKTGTFIAARLRACGWIGCFEVRHGRDAGCRNRRFLLRHDPISLRPRLSARARCSIAIISR
jgi:hypothetical protein